VTVEKSVSKPCLCPLPGVRTVEEGNAAIGKVLSALELLGNSRGEKAKRPNDGSTM